MLALPDAPITTERLTLRPLRLEHAAAMWQVLRDPAIYAWIDRAPPAAPGEVEARFARIAHSVADGREEQWLNWTVWTRADGAPIGIVEATVPPSRVVHIAYMFASRVWGRGFAREAVAAAMDAMTAAGAYVFEAVIDARNTASIALARRLGFRRIGARAGDDGSADEIWRTPQ
jgi:[ribosomal protein S5]-alanine N-acetyltransferase